MTVGSVHLANQCMCLEQGDQLLLCLRHNIYSTGALRGLFEALLALADVDLVARVALCRRPLVLAAKRWVGRGVDERERES